MVLSFSIAFEIVLLPIALKFWAEKVIFVISVLTGLSEAEAFNPLGNYHCNHSSQILNYKDDYSYMKNKFLMKLCDMHGSELQYRYFKF